MRSWIATIALISALAIISLMIIFNPSGKDNASDSCKDTSETVGEYRLCLALERCHDEFPDNSALNQDCLVNVFREVYR